MIKFKQFLVEMPHSNNMSPLSKLPNEIRNLSKRPRGKAVFGPDYGDRSIVHQKISSTATHDFYRFHDTEDKYADTEFHAVNKKTNKSDMRVKGTLSGIKNKVFKVGLLKGGEGSTIKAHEFYHHLIHAGHVNALVSDDSQSPGAQKVWKRLSKMPNIKMGAVKHEFDEKHDDYRFKPQPYNKRIERNYSNNWGSNKYERLLVAKADI